MSINWSNDYYVALEAKDLQANSMTVDYSGALVLLAGRKYIVLKNLDSKSECIQKFPRQSKYNVTCAEWCPNSHNRELCVLSSHIRLNVVASRKESLQNTLVLKGHTRPITDLNWHPNDPFLVTSCAVDGFVHSWDLRDFRRPSLSFCSNSEASQVRWNRFSPHILATAHDGDVRLWDQRKNNAPFDYISAHLDRIHSLDWSPHCENHLATSSHDNTVKFFDTGNTRRAELILTTNAPVWKARYTPFGVGLITAVIPPTRRNENSLMLWNISNRTTPMHTFIGHKDAIINFAWRKQRPGENTFQLITWSKDQMLQIWKIEPFLQKLVGHDPDSLETASINSEASEKIGFNNKKMCPNTYNNSKLKLPPLQEEFAQLNINIPTLEVRTMNAKERTCKVAVKVSNFTAHVKITFPAQYPQNAAPIFQINEDSTISDNMAKQLLQTINNLAQQKVAKNKPCLELCLRQMVTTLEQLATEKEVNIISENSFTGVQQIVSFGGCNDAFIPFPRTSGAKFCSVDVLVIFGRQPASRKLTVKTETGTPRALVALENSALSKKAKVSSFYYHNPRKSSRHSSSKLAKTLVHLYDSSQLFFVNKQLAEDYILDGDVVNICRHNASAAACINRWDLVQAWTLAELVASPQQAEEENTWSIHPFGNQLMQSLILHYASQNDLQMAAMLSCIFGKDQEYSTKRNSLKHISSSGCVSPYHTIPPADVIDDGWVFPSFKNTRSSSLDNIRLEALAILPQKNSPSSSHEYYKLAYAETLHRWGLLYNRTEVLKYMCQPPEPHTGVELVSECKNCLRASKFCSCKSCKKLSLNCVMCHISVRGSANCCVVCGHGGHTGHLQKWFEYNNVCPSGCGCKCLVETANVFAI